MHYDNVAFVGVGEDPVKFLWEGTTSPLFCFRTLSTSSLRRVRTLAASWLVKCTSSEPWRHHCYDLSDPLLKSSLISVWIFGNFIIVKCAPFKHWQQHCCEVAESWRYYRCEVFVEHWPLIVVLCLNNSDLSLWSGWTFDCMIVVKCAPSDPGLHHLLWCVIYGDIIVVNCIPLGDFATSSLRSTTDVFIAWHPTRMRSEAWINTNATSVARANCILLILVLQVCDSSLWNIWARWRHHRCEVFEHWPHRRCEMSKYWRHQRWEVSEYWRHHRLWSVWRLGDIIFVNCLNVCDFTII